MLALYWKTESRYYNGRTLGIRFQSTRVIEIFFVCICIYVMCLYRQRSTFPKKKGFVKSPTAKRYLTKETQFKKCKNEKLRLIIYIATALQTDNYWLLLGDKVLIFKKIR